MQDRYAVMTRGFKNFCHWGEIAGYQLQIHIPYYRGVFLSSVHELSLEVDGRPVPAADIAIEINERSFTIEQMMEADDVRWGYRDPAILRIRRPGGLTPGLHTVRLSILIRKSYMPPEDPEQLREFAWRDGKYYPFSEPPTVVTRQMTLVQ